MNVIDEMIHQLKTALAYKETRLEEARAEAARWQAVAVEERFKNMLLLDDDGQKFQAAGIKQCPKTCYDCEDDCDPSWCPSADFWRRQAAAALGQPRAWLMTNERKDAINSVLRDSFEVTDEEMDVIRAMQAEAGQ